MQELVKFYETAVIPYLKNKYGEQSVLMAELEATLIFNQNKINELEEKVRKLENISNSKVCTSNNVESDIPKKIPRNKKT
jgi:hypothetical protein